ncbi:MAG: hypothetical protein HY869_22090 [Chloroflexi bacterium]|nr:hypothetical protein [Chloroflexota bacterium]
MNTGFSPARALAWMAILSLVLAACSAPAPTADGPQMLPPTATQPSVQPSSTPVPPTPIPPTPTELVPQRPLSGLAADPQRIEFQASDGRKLVGYYYPSKYADAPLMILMHWAGGDLCDWSTMSPWLQNRADENPPQIERCAGSAGASLAGIFPPMAAEVSVAVFAFDFRNYGESEKGPSARRDLTLDALAAFEIAAAFEGVDASRMAAIGASIGADGAPDGCLLYNQKAGGGCVGALALSPGNYADMNFAAVVRDLAPVPVWCLAGDQDGESAPTCKSASGEHYRMQVYPDSRDHGMMLLTSDLVPPALDLIQEFMDLVFGEPMQ